MFAFASHLYETARAGRLLSQDDALRILSTRGAELTALFAAAHRLSQERFANRVSICAIVNAKSGRCTENCAFCAQSAHHASDVAVYPLKSSEEIVAGARAAVNAGAGCYGIVTSGTRIAPGEEFERILAAIRTIRQTTTIAPSASLGLLRPEEAQALVAAGCGTYHHNLETARSFFPQICTTHDYEEDVATVRAAKSAGMQVCCGGIFGLGESPEQRYEMAVTLRELDVDSVPLNFLNPIPGTPLADRRDLSPLDCLRIVALYRFVLPRQKIAVCGGREANLREFQSAIFMAGASGMMIGNYLTTSGRNLDLDLQLLRDADVEPGEC